MQHVNSIEVVRAERPRRDLRSGAYETGRVYADFVVDGVALSTLVRRKGDLISGLGWGTPGSQDAMVARLLLSAPPDLPSGRVSLYVCPECGDLSCGAITVRISRDGPIITWADFWYEGDHVGIPSNNRLLEDMGPYRFSWAVYESAIRTGYGLGRKP